MYAGARWCAVVRAGALLLTGVGVVDDGARALQVEPVQHRLQRVEQDVGEQLAGEGRQQVGVVHLVEGAVHAPAALPTLSTPNARGQRLYATRAASQRRLNKIDSTASVLALLESLVRYSIIMKTCE